LAVRQGGASFAVVTAEPISLPHGLVSIEAVNVVAPQTLGDAFAIVVRPDRYVAAVAATLDELESISEQLVASFFG
jgi:hypothetical protein